MSPAPIGVVCATAGHDVAPVELIPRVKTGFS